MDLRRNEEICPLREMLTVIGGIVIGKQPPLPAGTTTSTEDRTLVFQARLHPATQIMADPIRIRNGSQLGREIMHMT